MAGNTTDFFYTEIAKPYIENIIQDIEFCYFDIRDYKKIIENTDRKDDNQLIALYKILSPEHLLKLPFSNDSNYLDKNFYAELLHIIGLTETKVDGKRVIERNEESKRNSGTLLEDTIIQLDSLDKLSRIDKLGLYGNTTHERLFNVGLTLNITWINRILFLKLLEAQLITYHKGDKSYSFLTLEKIKNFDDLNSLFFQVLARKHEDRNEDVKHLFSQVPYLNSSLFEPTDVEHQTLFISNLKDNKKIPILSSTVLKDRQGKKRTGELACLEYLFDFLNAYDFSSEGAEDIQEENKTLINASVLGLIFEKINGYKDGSFFTPGIITMYMCRETLRRAVLQKFKETKGWACQDLTELFNKISDKKEAANIINEIKICDPAVGSGHFLVSALNELITIKWELGLLLDKHGRSLRDYNIEVENDELIITDEDGKLFEYKPNNKESQRVQETLFHEKQTIIEKCLFGVDINPNSVKICRLRLWIELLKNAYYKNKTELETLPNIDINIKNGNSLISRFMLDSDLAPALRKSKWNINSYRLAVDTYRNAATKEEKREMERLIEAIKSDFKSEIDHPFKKKLRTARAAVDKLATEINVQKQWGEKANKQLLKDFEKAVEKFKKIEEEKDSIETNKIYENAFEWRFEFPEVLDNDGNYVGFDVIIGNPPYIQLQKMGKDADALQVIGYETFARTGDIYSLFYEKGQNLLKEQGHLIFITSNKWMRAGYGESTRKFLAEKTNPILLVDFAGQKLFDTATVDTNILLFLKGKNEEKTQACTIKEGALNNLSVFVRQHSSVSGFTHSGSWVILSELEMRIKKKIEQIGAPLKDWDIEINYGIKTGFNDAFIITGEKRKELIQQDPKSEEIIRPILRGRDIKRYCYDFA
ncbi:MAG TPA: Eco57I restriction-modification methylase domain-containing protein, partial [Niabella sp.]|nr:Eco57I restriction-modification methylase domain-containing protein [Niabella sp.]